MEGFRFILENPHPNASNNKQRKRARLVTACDSCRIKKIKCQQSSPNARCEACKTAKTPCLFGDRDRYQAERGVTCTWNPPPPIEDAPASPEPSSRKRKMASSYPPGPSSSPDLWQPSTAASSTQPSRVNTPASDSMHNYRYFHSSEHPQGSSSTPPLMNEFNVFPSTTVPPDTNVWNNMPYESLPLFDPSRPRFPHPQRMRHLGALFFENMGAHFPFLDRNDVLHRIAQRTCSPILCNCIAGLAARFADPTRPDPSAGAAFYDMAKTLAAHVVSVPSVEALHALICITWAEYGSGHDSGFWMYSRMAIAMCLDLGLGNEATIQIAATPEVRLRLRFTWWVVVCTADIAAAWATGRPTVLDLDQYDTALPQVTDDQSLMFRTTTELYLLRARLTRILETHSENRGESSLDWDLSELQAEIKSLHKGLPPSLAFSGDNLTRVTKLRLGHVFLQMHLLNHALEALVNRPSLLPAYGLPIPTEGARVDAARTCAKSIVDILMVADEVAPAALQDPFLDLPILVACRIFTVESTVHPLSAVMTMSPRSNQLARQWSDTLLNKCKDVLVRLSSVWGGMASFDTILERRGGTLADDLRLSGSTSSVDLFTAAPSPHNWLIHPGLVDDGASDTSSSFRSSSHELSPRLAASAISNTAKLAPSSLRGSPLVQGIDQPELGLGLDDLSFHSPELFVPGATTTDAEADMFNMSSYLDEPCALRLSIDSPEARTLLHTDMYLRKDDGPAGEMDKSPHSLFSPLEWLSRT